MSDNLRDRIAAVQKAHIFCLVECSCGYQIDSIHPSSPDWKTDAECDWADHVADALFLDPALQRQVMRALLPDERMPTMTVHNHGTEEGKGLACRESMVNGELKGECMSESQSPAVLDVGLTLRDRIAKVLHQRLRPEDRLFDRVWDDEHPATQERWRKHADAVIAELGLQPESYTDMFLGRGTSTRYVTEWTTE